MHLNDVIVHVLLMGGEGEGGGGGTHNNADSQKAL